MRSVKSALVSVVLCAPLALCAAPARSQAQARPAAQPQAEPATAPLSNSDVSGMLKAGLSPEVVIAMIKSSPSKFDTSPAALEGLKAAGVPESVILAMVDVPRGTTKAAGYASSPALNANPPEAVSVKVPDGTAVEIELKENVSSEAVDKGSVIDFTVVQPVKVNDYTVIDRGAPARAHIVEVKKARHWGRAGQISWAMEDIMTVDGDRIPARFTKEAEGGGSSGKVAGAVVATAIVCIPCAPLWGIHKGHPEVMPAGQRFEVFVHGDSTVNVRPAAAEAKPTN